jgi:hypothetical protein
MLEQKNADTQSNTDVSSGETSTGVTGEETKQDSVLAGEPGEPEEEGTKPEQDSTGAEDKSNVDSPGETEGEETEETPEGAPEEYEDFEVPEGIMGLDSETIDGFKGVAKELNLTQEQAQKLVDFGVKREQAQHEMAEKWAEDFKQRPNYQEELRNAAKGRDFLAQDIPELKQILADPRIGNNHVFIRALEKVGRTISEDDMLEGSSRAKNPQSVEDVMFGDMFNN